MAVVRPSDVYGGYAGVGEAAKGLVSDPIKSGLAAAQKAEQVKKARFDYDKEFQEMERATKNMKEAEAFKKRKVEWLKGPESFLKEYDHKTAKSIIDRFESGSAAVAPEMWGKLKTADDVYRAGKGMPGANAQVFSSEVLVNEGLLEKYVTNLPGWDKTSRFGDLMKQASPLLEKSGVKDWKQAKGLIASKLEYGSDLGDLLDGELKSRYKTPSEATAERQAATAETRAKTGGEREQRLARSAKLRDAHQRIKNQMSRGGMTPAQATSGIAQIRSLQSSLRSELEDAKLMENQDRIDAITDEMDEINNDIKALKKVRSAAPQFKKAETEISAEVEPAPAESTATQGIRSEFEEFRKRKQ